MAIDLDAQALALDARRSAGWARHHARLDSARRAALVRNPRLLPAAVSGTGAGAYVLIDGAIATVAISTTPPASATTYPAAGSRVLADYDAFIATEGGRRGVIFSTSLWAPAARTAQGGAWAGGGGVADNMVRHAVETNAPAITFALLSAGAGGAKRVRVMVDGQYVDRAGHLVGDSGIHYVTIALDTSAIRTITLETQWRYTLQRVFVAQGNAHYLLQRPADRRPRLMVVADSYGIGPAVQTGIQSDATLTMQGDGMYQQAADWLGMEGIVSAIGGTSFLNGNAGQRYADRWQDVRDMDAQQPLDALHVHGSVNDVFAAADLAAVQLATSAYLMRAVQDFPALPITISGCLQMYASASQKAAQVEAAYAGAVANVVQQTGSTRLRFLPVQVAGQLYVPVWPEDPPSSLVCFDKVHLQPGRGGGHDSLGRRIAHDIARAWSDMS